MKLPVIVGICVLVLDQLTKFLVEKFLIYGFSINIISSFNFFNIINIKNTGTAFSILSGNNFLFSIFISLFLLLMIVWLCKNKNRISKIWQYAFCLVIAGGMGNLIDRLIRGAVVDFLDFGVNSLRWPAFNIADSCICIASCMILIDIVYFKRKVL